MKALALAKALIERFEGFKKVLPSGMVEAYIDPVGVWTIGCGITGPDVKKGTRWTRAQCDERLMEEIHKAFAGVVRASKVLAVDQVRAAAVTDFAFNLGVGAYQGSTLRRKVNERDWEEAGRQARRWVKAGGRTLPGLVLRREVEAVMLETGR